MYKALAKYYPNIIANNAHLMAEYGRFDDLFTLFNSDAEPKAIEIIANQLKSDTDNMLKGEPISLLDGVFLVQPNLIRYGYTKE